MIDIVLQGALNEYAIEVADHYSKLPFVHNIFLSCWNTDPVLFSKRFNVCCVRNEPVPNGVGNRNLQIKSSYEGLKRVQHSIVAKMRNDQKVSHESMQLMYNYYEEHGRYNEIYVAGIFPTFPFHPRDHIFWGNEIALKMLFNIPYDIESLSDDYNKYLRSEAYIGSHYCAKWNEDAKQMLLNKEDYLLDNSPKRNEAIRLSESLKLFKPFPKIDFEWPKYGMKEYHYDYTKAVYGEYQA